MQHKRTKRSSNPHLRGRALKEAIAAQLFLGLLTTLEIFTDNYLNPNSKKDLDLLRAFLGELDDQLHDSGFSL
jgi:hypothetical protein